LKDWHVPILVQKGSEPQFEASSPRGDPGGWKKVWFVRLIFNRCTV